MKETNKCEEQGLKHAWYSNNDNLVSFGYDITPSSTCANCGLKRTRCTEMKEWYSYSDGRPNEPIVNIRPV